MLPAISAASTPPAGMAYGKFHGDATTTTPSGVESAGTVGGGVVAGEVDRLGHLGIAFAHGLGGLGGHLRQRRPALVVELVGRPLAAAPTAPRAAGADQAARAATRGGDDGVDARHVVDQRVLAVGTSVDGVLGDRRGDVGTSLGDGEVGVGLVDEALARSVGGRHVDRAAQAFGTDGVPRRDRDAGSALPDRRTRRSQGAS